MYNMELENTNKLLAVRRVEKVLERRRGKLVECVIVWCEDGEWTCSRQRFREFGFNECSDERRERGNGNRELHDV